MVTKDVNVREIADRLAEVVSKDLNRPVLVRSIEDAGRICQLVVPNISQTISVARGKPLDRKDHRGNVLGVVYEKSDGRYGVLSCNLNAGSLMRSEANRYSAERKIEIPEFCENRQNQSFWNFDFERD